MPAVPGAESPWRSRGTASASSCTSTGGCGSRDGPCHRPWRNRWVRPDLVGEVPYTGWTDELRPRHPVWRGPRPGRIPSEVTR
ncbi:hypothetical protein AB0C18_02390 [Nonomuraea muscovyensis]|uniref:ATP dependent DNA ligase n=1 Tax=Nonomuraea muscovyensis TaxID=1124761 RepID=UPI0034013805